LEEAVEEAEGCVEVGVRKEGGVRYGDVEEGNSCEENFGKVVEGEEIGGFEAVGWDCCTQFGDADFFCNSLEICRYVEEGGRWAYSCFVEFGRWEAVATRRPEDWAFMLSMSFWGQHGVDFV
jgi:hypothetical protein